VEFNKTRKTMKKRILITLSLAVALFAGFLSAGLIHETPESVEASEAAITMEALSARIAQLEKALLLQARQDQQEEGGETTEAAFGEIDPRLYDALEAIAENTAYLEAIAERLEGIERELAWKRLDEEEGAE
jgi:hypothetical protein